ncbi:MAG: LytR/AlgR family response regulator transcription factor [Gemmatimonadales bacterium]
MTETGFRAVVVDDEPAAREAIRTLLAGESRLRIVAEATNGREAVTVLDRERPDLVFLDVQMPDLDGFEVLDELAERAPPGVVFVTAHDEHALRAFEVHALDYLLKPFGRPRFGRSIERALGRLAAEQVLTERQAGALHRTATPPRGEEAGTLEPGSAPLGPGRRLGIKLGSKTRVIEIDTIDWVEACGDYLRLHAGERAHLVSESMGNLERRLDRARFARVHRSIIVNVARITEMSREADGAGSVTLGDGTVLRVARGRWDGVEAALALVRL